MIGGAYNKELRTSEHHCSARSKCGNETRRGKLRQSGSNRHTEGVKEQGNEPCIECSEAVRRSEKVVTNPHRRGE